MAVCLQNPTPMIGHIEALLAAKLVTKPDKMVEYGFARNTGQITRFLLLTGLGADMRSQAPSLYGRGVTATFAGFADVSQQNLLPIAIDPTPGGVDRRLPASGGHA